MANESLSAAKAAKNDEFYKDMRKYIALFACVLLSFVCISCVEQEDFGFPSKIKMAGSGETIDIKGTNDIPASIIQVEVLDYNGDGNSSEYTEDKDCIETTTDWLSVKYFVPEYKLILTATPNETRKKRKLYLYLHSGRSWQEITVTQSK